MTLSMPLNPPKRAAPGLTLLDALVCAYLALPLLGFAAWFKWPVAIALAALATYAFCNALRGTQWRTVELRGRTIALIGVIALAWTALSGVGHFFYANVDWITRDAVLR